MGQHPPSTVPSPRPSGDAVPVPASRVHLAASVPTPSHVDGAWWPRSTDLVAELPALLEAVHDRTDRSHWSGFTEAPGTVRRPRSTSPASSCGSRASPTTSRTP